MLVPPESPIPYHPLWSFPSDLGEVFDYSLDGNVFDRCRNVVRGGLSPQTFMVWRGPHDAFWKEAAWERETYDVLSAYLNEDGTYVDIGSWIGPTVLYAAKIARKVYAVEPNPLCANILEEAIALNVAIPQERVSINRVAIGDYCGEATMSIGDSVLRSHSVVTKYAREDTYDTRCTQHYSWNVPMSTLQCFFEERGIASTDLVKIDAEGSELKILQSSRETLQRMVPNLLVELHPGMFNDGAAYVAEIFDSLAAYPYVIDLQGRPASRENIELDKWGQALVASRNPIPNELRDTLRASTLS